METKIAVDQGNILISLRKFLARLLESKTIQALLISLENENGTISPGLITDAKYLEKANPLAPVMSINNGRTLSALTSTKSLENTSGSIKIGAVLRPCEIRAAIELVKLQQVNLDQVLLISMDCPGTFETRDYYASGFSENGHLNEYLNAAKEGYDPSIAELYLRTACQYCVQQKPENVAIHFHLFGADLSSEVVVTVQDQIAKDLNLEECPDYSEVEEGAFKKLVTTHSQARQKGFDDIRNKIAAEGGLSNLLSTCIRCHNCQEACPICYCRLCLFDSEAFRHESSYYLRSAQRKGALRFLPDTLLFHMTRLNHMSLSCVSCGMCSSACPEHIPVSTLFSAVGSRVQKVFDYSPGRSIDDSLPLTCFQPGEWVDIGEER